MDRKLASSLAARGVLFGFVALLIYWVLPDSGVSALKKMDAAMQNARSWRVHTVVSEPTKSVESTMEVYCPSRVHTVSRVVMDESGTHFENSNEVIWIEGASYTKKGLGWEYSREERYGTASCTWGPRGSDTLLQQMGPILTTGKIRKGGKRMVNDTYCRDWIASVPAAAGWRDEFGVCIGGDDLPREVYAPDRRLVETYTDWNQPIRIEAPPAEDVRVK